MAVVGRSHLVLRACACTSRHTSPDTDHGGCIVEQSVAKEARIEVPTSALLSAVCTTVKSNLGHIKSGHGHESLLRLFILRSVSNLVEAQNCQVAHASTLPHRHTLACQLCIAGGIRVPITMPEEVRQGLRFALDEAAWYAMLFDASVGNT